MTLLQRCTGPPCPRCGCQDADVHEWPKDGSESWYSSGRATCKHCMTHFAFKQASRPASVSKTETVGDIAKRPPITQQNIPPISHRQERAISAPIDDRCPECGGDSRVTSTRKLWRHRKCKVCSHSFKTRREKKSE